MKKTKSARRPLPHKGRLAKTHVRSRKIYKNGKGEHGDGVTEGIFSGTRRGFGFVTDKSGALSEDIFIPKGDTHGALHGDLVRVRYRKKYPSGIEGRVTDIIEKSAKTIIGTLVGERVRGSRSYRKRYFLSPDGSHYPEFIPLSEKPDASEGDKIECAVLRVHGGIALSFLRTFGSAASFFANRASLLCEMGVPTAFEDGVEREAERVASKPISMDGRTRESDPVLTIDSESAKDLDDAVSLKKCAEGYLLSVHIADVSEYVKPKTALDRAAMSRGTSLYFADEVIPMLPRALSNGACSLGAGEDKYTLCARIMLSADGRILETRIERAVIRSDVRGVYTEVNDIFENGASSKYAEKYSKVYKMLFLMKELYEILERNARARGYLDFEAAEPYFLLDEGGYPVEILRRERGIAERLIEQFMLTANEGVARLLSLRECPLIFRVHDEPPADKLSFFRKYAFLLGLNTAPLMREPVSTLAFAEVFAEAKAKGKADALAIPMLRTMSKASYSAERADHFGLGLSHYCHFTSPIRRLSDLATHRIIKAVLLDGEDGRKYAAYARRAAAAASETELRALAAERAMNALYTALWAEGHIGEEFEASASGITAFGIFATLDNTAEGLIPIESLPFGSSLDEETLSAHIDGQALHLAERIRVLIESTSLSSRRVRFAFLEAVNQNSQENEVKDHE